MSRFTKERGEQKRNGIRAVFAQILKEETISGKGLTESGTVIKRHAEIMKSRKPQESCLVNAVLSEFTNDPLNFFRLGVAQGGVKNS